MTEEIRKAATAVVLRDTDRGLEVLLLRRHTQLRVGGGNWVFPGGTVDEEDFRDANSEEQAARVAAVRETAEEAAITLDVAALQLLSHWTTPPSMGRRFATWFFLTGALDTRVQVDGEEMDDHRWAQPRDFIAAHREGEMGMLPPTVVTLTELARCNSILEAQHFYASREVPFIKPQLSQYLGVPCMLYPGDAGYQSGNPDNLGKRNRCFLEDGVWRYEFFEG